MNDTPALCLLGRFAWTLVARLRETPAPPTGRETQRMGDLRDLAAAGLIELLPNPAPPGRSLAVIRIANKRISTPPASPFLLQRTAYGALLAESRCTPRATAAGIALRVGVPGQGVWLSAFPTRKSRGWQWMLAPTARQHAPLANSGIIGQSQPYAGRCVAPAAVLQDVMLGLGRDLCATKASPTAGFGAAG